MIYLDNSATTFLKPDSVFYEITEVMKKKGGNPGRSGHSLSVKASDVIFNARENVCRLFGIDNETRVCFTYNASCALNFAIKGVLDKGDHVIISSFEHNSVYRPVFSLQEKGVSFTVLPADPTGNFDNIENYIRKNTKLVIINHVSNVTGNIADIKKMSEIVHKYGVLLMVDASQSAGHIDIDVSDMCIDILACSGHKGLFGPQGTGILYVADGIKINTIIEGGTGSLSELAVQPDEFPDRFETGTLNTPGIGGLSKGLEFILANGVETIRKHEEKLIKKLIDGLSAIPGITVYGNRNYRKTSGAVGFNINNKDPVSVSSIVDSEYDICLRSGLHCSYLTHKTIGTLKKGCIRASVSFFTTFDEINYFLNIIDKINK